MVLQYNDFSRQSQRGKKNQHFSVCKIKKDFISPSQTAVTALVSVFTGFFLFLEFTSVIFHICFLVRLSSVSFFVSNLLPLLLLLSTPITPTLFYTSKLLEGMWSVWWVSGAYSSPAAALPLTRGGVCVHVLDGVQIQYKVKILWCLSKAHLTVTILGASSSRRQEHSFANTFTCLANHVVCRCVWFLFISANLLP